MQYNTLFKWGMFSIKEVILTHLGIFKAKTLSWNSISRLDKKYEHFKFPYFGRNFGFFVVGKKYDENKGKFDEKSE